MSFAQIDALCRRLEALDHAQAMLGVDEAVNMPEGGGEKRAEAMSVLASMSHEMASAPHIADWIDKAGATVDDKTDGKYAEHVAKVKTGVSATVTKLADRTTGSKP